MEESPVRATFITVGLLLWVLTAAAAQTPATAPAQAPAPNTQKPGMKPRPPLLFSEPWRLPPYTGERTDENMRFTPAVVTNPRLEVKLYGPDAKVVLASIHEERVDLWNGMATSPVAITLRDRRNYVDLTDPLAKIRWVVRTSGFHQIRPLVKLADGTWLVGDHTSGPFADFNQTDVSIADVRWMKIDPARMVTVGVWVERPDLSRVDEVGFADLMPGSGHGSGGYVNVAKIEVFGKPVKR